MTDLKQFNRNICFTFFEDYRLTAKELEKDFGKETVSDYYNSIIDYALYEIEPKLEGPIKYIWYTTKTTVDKSIQRRASGFGKENAEQTEVVLKYKQEHPEATQREIAEVTGVSLGKVNKVLKKNLSTIATTATDTLTITCSDTNTNNELEHEHSSHSVSLVSTSDESSVGAAQQSEKLIELRDLEDLSNEELYSLLEDFQHKVKYNELKKKYSLMPKFTNKNLGENINEILKERDGILADDYDSDSDNFKNLSNSNASKKKDTSDTYIYSIAIPTNMNHSTDYYVRDFSNSITYENAIEKFDELTDPFGFYRFKKAFVKTWFDYEGLPYVDDDELEG